MTNLLNNLSNTYGLEFIQILNHSEKGYRNKNLILKTTDKSYNLVIYKREKGILTTIKSTNQFYKYLNSNNIPTRKVIRTKSKKDIIVLKSNNINYYASLYSFIEGSTLPWEGWNKSHLKTIGCILALIHSFKIPEDLNYLSNVVDIEIEHLNRMQTYFSNEDVSKALSIKLKLIVNKDYLESFYSTFTILRSQKNISLLHMDLVRGNVIWNNKNLAGIIDGEKVCKGLPIFEIARTFSFLLVDCKYKTAKEVFKYFLVKGYLKETSLFNGELLQTLVDFYLIYDFYKFLKHSPYESLEKNEHFLRTRFILLKRKILITQ